MSALEDTVRAIVREEIAAAAGGAPAQPATEAPAKRGRGRPVKGESDSATAPAPPAPAAEPDPFASPAPAAPAVPTATIDDVRAALTALKTATSQDNAVSVLKSAGGADNLTQLKPERYDAVVAAAKAAVAPAKVEEDPFAVPAPAAAAPAKPLTIEDVKAAVLAATKRSGVDRAAKVVMDLGGKAPKPDGTGYGPSWTALPKEKYAEAIAGLNALPTTK